MLIQFKQYLDSRGIKPLTENEGEITFQSGGLYYIFVHVKEDPNYFRLILPNIYKIEGDWGHFEKFINELNQVYKVAKTYIASDGMVWTTTEQYVFSREGIDKLFETCISLLQLFFDKFRTEVSKK